MLVGEYGLGAAPEAPVVDAGNAVLVVRELVADFGFGYAASEFGFFRDVVSQFASEIRVPGYAPPINSVVFIKYYSCYWSFSYDVSLEQ